jgi:hypothetical protein
MKANSISQIIAGSGKVRVAGIQQNRDFRHKGWFCRWNEFEGLYYLYTPEEMEQPCGCRYHEWECETKEECKQFITRAKKNLFIFNMNNKKYDDFFCKFK